MSLQSAARIDQCLRSTRRNGQLACHSDSKMLKHVTVSAIEREFRRTAPPPCGAEMLTAGKGVSASISLFANDCEICTTMSAHSQAGAYAASTLRKCAVA